MVGEVVGEVVGVVVESWARASATMARTANAGMGRIGLCVQARECETVNQCERASVRAALHTRTAHVQRD